MACDLLAGKIFPMEKTFRDLFLAALAISRRSVMDVAREANVPYDRVKALSQGKAATTSVETAAGIARAFGVTLDDFLAGRFSDQAKHAPATPRLPPGMAEDAAAFFPAPPAAGAPDSREALALFFPGHAAITHRATNHLPELGIGLDDLIVCDLSRLAEPGDVAIVTLNNDATASGKTLLRRYAPPWLLTGHPAGALIRVSDPGISVRFPVIGVIKSFAR